jgi:glycosyltransferase involved in cell wall biosynthesis
MSQFPETHETFILRELVALDEAGLDFVIFSLKPCRDLVVQKDAERFASRTYYPWSGECRGWGGDTLGDAFRASRGVVDCRRSALKSAYLVWAARRLTAAARRLGVGHLHAHWATAPTSAAAVMSRLLGVDYSFTAHAWDIFAGDGLLSAKACGASFIVTCTRYNVGRIRSMIENAEAGKVLLNYHGVSAAEVTRRASPSRTLKIAAVGRMVETKGFEHLIEAVAAADFPVEVVFAGDGPLMRSLKRRARSAGRAVRFEGVVPNERVMEILAGSDVFVMPSVVAGNGDMDGIPNVMLEAMSVGLPVIASRVSGIPEAVIDGRTGLLVEPGDSAAILSALRAVREDAHTARRMGEAGRTLVSERFNARCNALSLYQIFAGRLRGAPR